mmetsp:Transcript_25161/g.18949  ORF Transcript_25161/g.18949 Transcript_25161/m.18949 type:complete len:150 (+) Transcript_25161:688-1137(+)
MMGGCRWLGIPSALWTVLIGMVILGVASNMIFVVYMPELAATCFSKVGKENDPILNDKLSGIFTAFFCFGFFLAPLTSGLLVDLRSFSFSCNVMAVCGLLILFTFCVFFIYRKEAWKLYLRVRKIEEQDEERKEAEEKEGETEKKEEEK